MQISIRKLRRMYIGLANLASCVWKPLPVIVKFGWLKDALTEAHDKTETARLGIAKKHTKTNKDGKMETDEIAFNLEWSEAQDNDIKRVDATIPEIPLKKKLTDDDLQSYREDKDDPIPRALDIAEVQLLLNLKEK